MRSTSIKNIIFDLGGVLLNIDYHKTSNAFKDLGITDIDNLYSQAQQSSLFDDIETGKINAEPFLEGLRQLTSARLSSNDLTNAWNAMLLDMPKQRLELLQCIKNNYNIYLLSNTNIIHYDEYYRSLNATHGIDFNKLFIKTYYSHEIGYRKPTIECFNFVCNNAGIKPSQTLFIDDSIQHIEGAKNFGLNAHHLLNQEIKDIFNTDGWLI